jgi:hypothetical protein
VEAKLSLKTVKVTLGGTDYTVAELTLNDMEELSVLLSGSGGGMITFKTSVEILKIAMRGAEPKIDDIGKTLRSNIPEVGEALNAILKLTGIDTKAHPPEAVAPAA